MRFDRPAARIRRCLCASAPRRTHRSDADLTTRRRHVGLGRYRLQGPDGITAHTCGRPSRWSDRRWWQSNTIGTTLPRFAALAATFLCRRLQPLAAGPSSSHFAPAAIHRRITATCSADSRSFSFGGICSDVVLPGDGPIEGALVGLSGHDRRVAAFTAFDRRLASSQVVVALELFGIVAVTGQAFGDEDRADFGERWGSLFSGRFLCRSTIERGTETIKQ